MPGPIGSATPLRTPTAPAPRARTVDAGAIDPASAEFRALPPAWQQAVRDARAFQGSLQGVSPLPRVLVCASAANGGAPVSVIVPANATAPVQVHTHYHGDGARALAANPTNEAIAKQLRGGDPTVFVLPEAQQPGAPTDWTNVRGIGAVADDALAAAGLDGAVGARVVSVHSAGGRALKQAIEGGERLRADQLIIQDALFEGNTGRGVATFLKQRLADATGDVGRITLVPSTSAGAAGLMKDLDEPRLTRTQVLERALTSAGRSVTVAGVASHDDAARVLTPPARSSGWVP
jgi:hypothetical protein